METLGIARVVIDNMRIQRILEGWVYVRVPVTSDGKRNSLEVADNRPGVVEIGKKIDTLSTEINNIKKRRSTGNQADLQAQLGLALKEFQNEFNSPAIVSVEDKVTIGGETSYQRVVLNDAEEDEPDAIFTVVRTASPWWHRSPRSAFASIFSYDRTSVLHPVIANHEGVRIWELDENNVRVFNVSFPDGIKVTTYAKVDDKVDIVTETTRVQAPPAEPEDEELKEEEEAVSEEEADETDLFKTIGFTNGDLEKITEVGIQTVEEFLNFIKEDVDYLAKETGLSKSRLLAAGKKLKKATNHK